MRLRLVAALSALCLAGCFGGAKVPDELLTLTAAASSNACC